MVKNKIKRRNDNSRVVVRKRVREGVRVSQRVRYVLFTMKVRRRDRLVVVKNSAHSGHSVRVLFRLVGWRRVSLYFFLFFFSSFSVVLNLDDETKAHIKFPYKSYTTPHSHIPLSLSSLPHFLFYLYVYIRTAITPTEQRATRAVTKMKTRIFLFFFFFRIFVRLKSS